MVLVHHQIEPRLLAIPSARGQHRGADAAAADDANTLDHFLRHGAGKIVGEPHHLMPAFDERPQIGQRDAFRTARQEVVRVAPVQH